MKKNYFINYLNKFANNPPTNLILFVDENFNINGLKKTISNIEFSYISDLLKTSDLKKKILFFKVNSKKTIFFLSTKVESKSSKTKDLVSTPESLIVE